MIRSQIQENENIENYLLILFFSQNFSRLCDIRVFEDTWKSEVDFKKLFVTNDHLACFNITSYQNVTLKNT